MPASPVFIISFYLSIILKHYTVMIGLIICALLAIFICACIMPWWFIPMVVVINIVAISLKGMWQKI